MPTEHKPFNLTQASKWSTVKARVKTFKRQHFRRDLLFDRDDPAARDFSLGFLVRRGLRRAENDLIKAWVEVAIGQTKTDERSWTERRRRKIVIQVPASRWQHFRQAVLPRWWLKRHPVKTADKDVEVEPNDDHFTETNYKVWPEWRPECRGDTMSVRLDSEPEPGQISLDW